MLTLSEPGERVLEAFTEAELEEIRDALRDREQALRKLVKKELEHGRKEDEESWAGHRLHLLTGDEFRAGILTVFKWTAIGNGVREVAGSATEGA